MSRLRLALAFVPALICVAVFLGASWLDRKDPHELIARAIEAHGGKDRISWLELAHTRGTLKDEMVVPKQSFVVNEVNSFEELIDLPHRYKRTTMIGQNTFRYLFLDGEAWVQKNEEKATAKGATHSPGFPTFVLLALLRHEDFETVSYVGRKSINGRSTAGVTVEFTSGLISHWYFDAKSHLLVSYLSRWEGNDAEIVVVDYRDIHGLIYPIRMNITNRPLANKVLANTVFATDFRVIDIEFPESIDDSEFEKPTD